MIKTGHDIQDEIYNLLLGSSLALAVTGKVYKNGYRPRDSRLEDIVVTFTQSTAAQVQDGIVTVNIYVPDVDPYADGTWVEDGSRTAALEKAAIKWLEGISPSVTDLRLEAYQAPFTMEDNQTRQHFVTLRIRFRYLDEQLPEPVPPEPTYLYDIFPPQLVRPNYGSNGMPNPCYASNKYHVCVAVENYSSNAKYVFLIGSSEPWTWQGMSQGEITESNIASWKSSMQYTNPMTQETEDWLRERIGRTIVTNIYSNLAAGLPSVLAADSSSHYESKPVIVAQ